MIKEIDYEQPFIAGKTISQFLWAREQVKAGKKVLFGYSDIKAGIKQLLFYFPGALIEVIGEHGLQVWERNKDNGSNI